MADNNIFFVNGVETSSAAEVQTALDQATSGISISVWNGDISFSGDHTSAGAINLNVGGTSDGTYEGGSTTNWCTEFQKDNTLSSTVTFNSDFKGTVTVFTGTNSENSSYADSTAENANMRLIFDGAEVTGGNFYNFNYGYIEFKNGAKFDNKTGTGHIRGDVLVTGEGTDVKIALERVYGDDFGADNIVTATLTVADGARFYDTVGDANVLNLGKTASNRQGKIIINGGTYQSRCTIAFATYGTISISNSTVNGKTYYGKMLFDSTAGNPTLNFSGAAANALTISVNSADYADLKESYKIIELADPDSTLDVSKISVTVDGAAYTLGTTFGGSYSIKQVDNDLVLDYADPYRLDSQNFVTDTTLSGTDKAYYRNPDENYSGFSSIYNVGSGSTLTIAEGAAVDLERNASGTKSIILVGANDYFASQGFEATGAGDLVVNGTLDVGQLNAMADGTITVNGELNITTACIEKGALIYNTGSTGEINCLNIFNNANATVTVNGLAAITLAGEPAHALKDNGATDTASRFIVNVTDADLAAMTGDTHTILNVKSSDVSIADKFTVKVNGAAYTLGEQFTTASGDTYVINMGDADGDSTANDLILTFVPPPPIKVTNPDSSTQSFDSLLTANEFAQDGAVVEFVTSSFTDATVVAANSSLILDKDITFKGKTTATFGITGSGYLMFGNTSTSKAINVTVAEGSDITFDGVATGVNLRYGVDTAGNKIASTLTIDNARMATPGGITSNGLVTVKGAGVKGTYGIGVAADDTFNAKYLVANIATGNLMSVKDRFDRYADDIVLNLTDYAYLVAANGITIGSEDGTITSIVSVENSKIEFVSSNENGICAFTFNGADGNKLQISGDSEVLVKTFAFSKSGIITIDGADAYVRAKEITVADNATATLNVTLTTEQLAAQALELGVNTAIFEISGDGDNLLETTITLDGAAYTLGDEIVDDAGNKYVIKMGDANGDSVENDLVIKVTARKPNLSTSDVYVGNLTGKDGVAVHDTANKLTIIESDGTMSEGAVWGLGDWDMLDVADVNGDGADDILISYQHDNNVTGVAALINQQDGSYGMVHQDIRGWSNDLWEYLCSADVNGDGTEDILTIEPDSIAAGRDKNVNAWIMDSTGQYSEDMRICGKNTDWEIEGFGDVTGDGKADGILRFKKLVAFWEHDGEKDSVLKEVGQMSTSWKVIGSDDFTGDGLADILFGNSSAQYKLWTDIGEKSYTEINLGTMKNSSLELAGIGDFNGDGKADILWQAADGGLHWGEAESGKLNNLTTIA